MNPTPLLLGPSLAAAEPGPGATVRTSLNQPLQAEAPPPLPWTLHLGLWLALGAAGAWTVRRRPR